MSRTTDVMRGMLKASGVEFEPTRFSTLQTAFTTGGIEWIVTEREATGELFLETRHSVTPSQLIAVTLGSGTCRNVSKFAGTFKCSECGAEWRTEDLDLVEPTLWVDGVADYPRFCQKCGLRIGEED